MTQEDRAEREELLLRLTLEDAVVPGATVHEYRVTPTRRLRVHAIRCDTAPRPSPAAMLFHGGGWAYGSPLFVGPHARALLELGLDVALVEYRVSHRDGTTIPDAVDDAVAAARWFFEHAAELGVDPGRIVLAGSSAGAHLALMTAETLRGAFRALVLWNTPCDLREVAPGAALTHDDRKRLSPVTYSGDGAFPPSVLFHGADDAVVPLSGAARFATAVNAAGGSADLVTFAGGHGFERPAIDGGENLQVCIEQVSALLVRAGVLTQQR